MSNYEHPDAPPKARETAGKIAVPLQTGFPCLFLSLHLLQSLGTNEGEWRKITACRSRQHEETETPQSPLLLISSPTCFPWPAVDYETPRKSRWADFTFNQSKAQAAPQVPDSKCPDYEAQEMKKYYPYIPGHWKMRRNTGKHYGPNYVSMDANLQ